MLDPNAFWLDKKPHQPSAGMAGMVLMTGIEPVIFPYQRNVFPLSPQELIYFLDLRDDEESIDAFLAFAALLLAFKGFIFV